MVPFKPIRHTNRFQSVKFIHVLTYFVFMSSHVMYEDGLHLKNPITTHFLLNRNINTSCAGTVAFNGCAVVPVSFFVHKSRKL